MAIPIVRARVRHGTQSFDLTIPTKIVKVINLKEGDAFTVESSKKDGKIVLTYTLIFKQ